MTLQGQQKLGRLADRAAAAHTSLTDSGRAFLAQLLRWHFGVKPTKPHLAGRGRSLDVVRYERQILERRAQEVLARADVRAEVEAAGGAIR